MTEEDFLLSLVKSLLASWEDFWIEHICRSPHRRYDNMDPENLDDINFASEKVLKDYQWDLSDDIEKLEQIWEKYPETKQGYMDDYRLEDHSVLETICILCDKMAAKELANQRERPDIPLPHFVDAHTSNGY